MAKRQNGLNCNNQIEMIYCDVGRIYNKYCDPAHIDLGGMITSTEHSHE